MLVLAIEAVALGVFLAGPAPADAHELGRRECGQYQRMHAFVTGSPARARAAGRACRVKAAAHVLTHPLPDRLVPVVLRRIRDCESGDRLRSGRARPASHDYGAENETSTASGAYQFLDSTWGGFGGYGRAVHAPPRVQDRKAIRHLRLWGTSPWNESRGCWS